MKTKILIIGMMILLSSCSKRKKDNEDKKQFEFNKIEVVFNNSNDTITYKNVTSSLNGNWYFLEDDSKINANNIKYIKEYKNSEFDRTTPILVSIVLVIVFFGFLFKVFLG